MKKTLFGLLIGLLIGITTTVLFYSSQKREADCNTDKEILVIPKSEIVPSGEGSELIIIPQIGKYPRWFDAVGANGLPTQNVKMVSAKEEYAVCAFIAPEIESSSEKDRFDINISVTSTDYDSGIEDVISKKVHFRKKVSNDSIIWIWQPQF